MVCFFVIQLSKEYGSIFTVYFGPKKVVVLAGYKAVKQALVNLSEEFGDRDITPIFHDFNQGLGMNSACTYLNEDLLRVLTGLIPL